MRAMAVYTPTLTIGNLQIAVFIFAYPIFTLFKDILKILHCYICRLLLGIYCARREMQGTHLQ